MKVFVEGAMRGSTMVKSINHFEKEKVSFCEDSFIHKICTCFKPWKRQKVQNCTEGKFQQNEHKENGKIIIKNWVNQTEKCTGINVNLDPNMNVSSRLEKLLWKLHRIEKNNSRIFSPNSEWKKNKI